MLAVAKDDTIINHVTTARHGYRELNQYFQNHQETLLDGLFVLHNPHALHPVGKLDFQLRGLAQISGKAQSIVPDIHHGYLLERTIFTAIPT